LGRFFLAVFFCLVSGLVVPSGRVIEAVAASGHLNNFGVVEEAVQNGCGRRDVVEQFAPFFDGPIGGHEGGAILITAQDDLQEDLAGFGGQALESHVIHDEQVGFEIAGQATVQFGGRGLGLVWSCIRSVGAEVASSGRSRIARGKIKHRIQIGKIEANAFLWKKRQG